MEHLSIVNHVATGSFLGPVKSLIKAVFIASVILVVRPYDLRAQNGTTLLEKATGKSSITHIDRSSFKGDPQFWSVCEDSLGVLYFGNNDGGLVFDGEYWQTVELPNKSSIRSLKVIDNRVYAGGFHEFGTIDKNTFGEYEYHSLIDSLHLDELELEMVWQIHSIEEKIVLRTFENIIIISGGNVYAINASSQFENAFKVEERYFVQTEREGLQELDFGEIQLKAFLPTATTEKDFIIFLHKNERSNSLFAIGRSGKVYRLNVQKNELYTYTNIFGRDEKNLATSAVSYGADKILVGTLSGALYSVSLDGSKRKHELYQGQTNDITILDLFIDKSENLWVLLNNGLDYFNLKSTKTTLFDQGSVYDAFAKNDTLLIATNRGVFRGTMDLNNNSFYQLDFENLEGLEGQAWKICELNDQVFVAHDKGLFLKKSNGFEKIGNLSGVWKVVPIKDYPNRALVCTYTGIYVIKTTANSAIITNKIEGFDVSSRDIAEGEKPREFWVCHGYDGVYRIKLSQDLQRITTYQHFTTASGLPSYYNVNVSQWEGQTVFTTNQGIYQFDEALGSFVPHPYLNEVLNPNYNYRKLVESGEKTWFIENDELGFFDHSKPNPTLHKELFLGLKGSFNRGMECIIPLNDTTVVAGTNSGLHKFVLAKELKQNATQTLITSATYQASDDQNKQKVNIINETTEFPKNTTFLKFGFAAPGLNKSAPIVYSYLLEGMDYSWSDWQETPYKEYSHLPSGKYTFQVKAKTTTGDVAQAANYSFSIAPYWYQTYWGILVIAAAGVGLISILILTITRKLRNDNAKEKIHQEEVRRLLQLEVDKLKLLNEKKAIEVQSEQLRDNLLEKNKELANYTIQLVKKKEIFVEIQNDLLELRSEVHGDKPKFKITEIFQKLSGHKIGEKYMTVFDINFEKVHGAFINHLKTKNPELTKRELRICAFIKMDLTNKEISPLLNISVRGVETARYRIRKKIGLQQDQSLSAYLESLSDQTLS